MLIREQQNDLSEILALLPHFQLSQKGTVSTLQFNKRKLLPRYLRMLLFMTLAFAPGLYILYTHRDDPRAWKLALYFLRIVGFALLLGTLPWIITWLAPPSIAIDHEQQELRAGRKRLPVYQGEEFIVRDNLLSLTKSSASYQLRFKAKDKRSVQLLRSLEKEDAVAIARWLQMETGLPIRVSDKYF